MEANDLKHGMTIEFEFEENKYIGIVSEVSQSVIKFSFTLDNEYDNITHGHFIDKNWISSISLADKDKADYFADKVAEYIKASIKKYIYADLKDELLTEISRLIGKYSVDADTQKQLYGSIYKIFD